MSLNVICPQGNDITHFTPLMNCVILGFKDHPLSNLTNDSYHAEVVQDIECADTRLFSTLQMFK